MDSQSSEREETDDDIELCILCESPTNYKISDHVDTRNAYIEGMGQLCGRCHYDHYMYQRESPVSQMLFDLE